MSDRDEQLRARLAGIDPVPPTAPVNPVTGPRAHELLERIMQTNPEAPALTAPSPSAGQVRWWQRPALVGAAAAAVLVLGAGSAFVLTGDDGPTPLAAPTTVALTTGPGAALASCLPFDVATLRAMSVAFSGTVASVEATSVTLDVDRWYAGGTADQVRISSPAGETSIALDGSPQLVVGERYLISAQEGTVSGCGYSGAFSEELAESFQQAFPG